MKEKGPTRVGEALSPKPVSDGVLIEKIKPGTLAKVIINVVDKMADMGEKLIPKWPAPKSKRK